MIGTRWYDISALEQAEVSMIGTRWYDISALEQAEVSYATCTLINNHDEYNEQKVPVTEEHFSKTMLFSYF